MISSCGSDERGKYIGGEAGDQTGNEWRVMNWYRYSNGGWNFVARHPNTKVAKSIAKLAEDAARNNNVGYDQGQRLTYWRELSANDYDASAIKNKCEADCSSGVMANAKAAGYICGDIKLQNIDNTVATFTMESALKNAGFNILRDSRLLTSEKYLQPGDILVNIQHHTVTALDFGASATEPIDWQDPDNQIPSGNKTINGGVVVLKSTNDIVKEVIAGKWGNGTARKKALESAGYNYYDVQFAVNKALNSTQKTASSSSKVVIYRVTATGGLRVRKQPNTTSTIVRILQNNSKINVQSVENGWAKLDDGYYVCADYIVKA